jgi:hypothetical protein
VPGPRRACWPRLQLDPDELVQIRESLLGNSLCDTLGTRIGRAIHVGAQRKQALHVRVEVFGYLLIDILDRLEFSSRFSCLDQGLLRFTFDISDHMYV